MGIRIDCSNPIRRFLMRPRLDGQGRPRCWSCVVMIGRYYLLTLKPVPRLVNGELCWEIEIRRLRTLVEDMDLSPRIAQQEISFPPADPAQVETARAVVVQHRLACPQLLQRTMHVNYQRASGLIDALTREGTLGPPHGGKYRDVLTPVD